MYFPTHNATTKHLHHNLLTEVYISIWSTPVLHDHWLST